MAGPPVHHTADMPTYEYRCPNGHDFEHFVTRMSDASGTMTCPTCGATAERRISAGGGLLFKGSGFYITDYKKKSGAPKSESSGSTPSKSSETKPPAPAANK